MMLVFKTIGWIAIGCSLLVLQACEGPEFDNNENADFGDEESVNGVMIDGDFTGVPFGMGAHCSGAQSSTGSVGGTVTSLQSVGDSFLDFNSETRDSIPQQLAQMLDVPVYHNAEGGSVLGGRDIQRQYEDTDASHVLISGGGNDLAAECSRENLDSLISADGQSGYMVDIVDQITDDGGQALIMGYFTPINGETPCQYFEDLLTRYRQLGANRANTAYICTLDTITPAQPSLYADSIHASPEGSGRIAAKLAGML